MSAVRKLSRVPHSLDPRRHRTARWKCDWTKGDLERLTPEALLWLEQFSEEYYQGMQRKGRTPLLDRDQLRESWRVAKQAQYDVTSVAPEVLRESMKKKTKTPYEPEDYDHRRPLFPSEIDLDEE